MPNCAYRSESNVFYEAGRRHESGKPFIQLIKKNERIPFDVAGIRTIIYDQIESLPSAAKTIEEIQKFVDEFEKSGYGSAGTGVSLSTIAGALDRIEQKLGKIMSSGFLSPSNVPSGTVQYLGYIENPREAYMTAIASGDINKAASLLPRLEQLLGPSAELSRAAAYLTPVGYEPALDVILRILQDHFEKLLSEGIPAVVSAASAAARFYINANRESEGVPRMEPIFEKIISLPDIDDQWKSICWNQLQMLYYGSKDYETALNYLQKAMELAPDDTAYMYNASLIYESLNLEKKCLEMVDRYMKMEGKDASHLGRAVEIYIKAGRIQDAQSAFAQLQKIDMGKASLLLMDSEVRKALRI